MKFLVRFVRQLFSFGKAELPKTESPSPPTPQSAQEPPVPKPAPKPNPRRFNTMVPSRMVVLEISDEEYASLPGVETIVGDLLLTVPLGFRFKAEDGHVCELVKGKDMFEHQWASMCVPERGLRHYNPIVRRPLFSMSDEK